MLKRVILVLTLSVVPTALMAQTHNHNDADKKHEHAAQAADHVNCAEFLMQKRAELKLTSAQIAKLEELSAKMTEHHKAMKASGMKHDHAAKHDDAAKHDHAAKHDGMGEDKMHAELMAIFTPEQLAKVKPLMKEHMEGKCEQCKEHHKKAE